MSTYVYGITDRTHPAPPAHTTGVGRPPCALRTVTAAGLAAVVSDVPRDLRPGPGELMAHHRVLDRTGAAGTVLPLRFGAVAPDDDTVRTVLSRRAAHFRERLGALAGRSEYRVIADHDERGVLRRVLADRADVRAAADAANTTAGSRGPSTAGSPEPSGAPRPRPALGELVQDAVRDQAVDDARVVQAALEPLADGVETGPEAGSGRSGRVLDVVFLVGRGAAGAFRDAVAQVGAARPYLRLRVEGPLPPYSFVDPGPADTALPDTGGGDGCPGLPSGPLGPRLPGYSAAKPP